VSAAHDLPVIVKHDRRYKDGHPQQAIETEAMTRISPAKSRPNETDLAHVRGQLRLAEMKYLRLHAVKGALGMSGEDVRYFELKLQAEIARWRDAERALL
jgi:hypothetical protein